MFVEVILPLPLAGTFTYAIQGAVIAPRRGMRVLVPFGKKKIYTAIIYLVHSVKPQHVDSDSIREIIDFLDDEPILLPAQLRYWEWLAHYYMCSLGDIYKAAVPAAFKIESESKVRLNPDCVVEELQLPDNQQRVVAMLADQKEHSVAQLTKHLDVKNLAPTLKKLVELGAIFLNETVENSYSPKQESYVVLHPQYTTPEELQTVFTALKSAPKQLKLFLYFLELSTFLHTGKQVPITRKQLLERSNASQAILKGLVDRQILQIEKQQVSRLQAYQHPLQEAKELNQQQVEAVQQVRQQWQNHPVVLLHGVTSSGKTEVYIKLIKKCLKEQKQVLFLVPEIALTTQLTTRLEAVFGDKLGVYHSKFSDAERLEIYENLLHNRGYKVIIGVRSSLFLPFRQLGLIIVDEEHEPSYKQQDPAPRYHARNAAIVLAQMHGAKVLLGSATPSVESYYNAQTGKYGLVSMLTRYKGIALPTITVVDTKEAYRKKMMTAHFSDTLITKIEEALERHEQVILFQNRRGYAPYLECKKCGFVPKCMHCDVSLTVHKKLQKVVCHYCGFTQSLPNMCPDCNTPSLSDRGFGTEKIEDEIKQLFPNRKVLRMDLDTTRSKRAYQKLIDDFANKRADILVGTQMVSKGLNFDHVQLVAVLNADQLLNQADFRAFERSFQLLEQVSGRAGRSQKQGEVYIQTANPTHPVINQVVAHNYVALYNQQIQEREQFRYPPFYRMLQLVIRHRDPHTIDTAAQLLATRLQTIFGNRCSHVVMPMVSRVQNLYIRHIIIRIEVGASIQKAKQLLHEQLQLLPKHPQAKGVQVYVDVDPM